MKQLKENVIGGGLRNQVGCPPPQALTLMSMREKRWLQNNSENRINDGGQHQIFELYK